MSSRVAGKSSCAPDEALIKLRRERKRTTDRAAQREHRRRQKLYVEELEMQLARVREGSVNDQVAQLMRENERLQKELNKYRSFFNSVEDLVMDEWQQENRKKHGMTASRVVDSASGNEHGNGNSNVSDDNNCIGHDNQSIGRNFHRAASPSQNPAEHNHATPNPSAPQDAALNVVLNGTQLPTQPHSNFLNSGSQSSPTIERVEPTLVNGTSEQADGPSSWTYMSPQGAFDWSRPSFENVSLQHCQPQVNTQAPNVMWNDNASSFDGSKQPDLLQIAQGDFVADCTQGSSPQQIASLPLPCPSFFSLDLNELDPALIFAPPNHAGPLIHQLLPRILEPQNAEDHHIQSIVERARIHDTRLTSPTLADFLCDNPDNELSTAIKHYLEPVRRTRRTIEFLATYWVLYLLLRWQINRDEESFHNVPIWLRPSVTQTRVYHPIGTDLLAWPLLRDEVIMRSLKDSEQATDIMTDIGLNLEVNIPLHKFSLSHDVDFLHAAISDLNNWRLNEAFFGKYPSLRSLYDSSFDVPN
ncbi:hypothetical protein BU24DRAFT_456092 [Aaosphaeria arxii CBS 175.79]|uniref:BZIP domain-containing protein n=1 Tax=Aaosphaeria arxii CBS 175.79 TaxID=1450172 RepID=A0A6A5X766_9PLEO|nr:uncharacterized protein BU24DRAFT_456092 [Aaosphaeria arxii CBS 175.79]KAF2008865.1 hypothetical protein BU24DRAFT_456092 [Aaosphaeria arxii CBS 175.79]